MAEISSLCRPLFSSWQRLIPLSGGWGCEKQRGFGGAGTDRHSTEIHNVPPSVKGTAPIGPRAQQLVLWLCLWRKIKPSHHRERATCVIQELPSVGHRLRDGTGRDGMGWVPTLPVSRACESPVLRHGSPVRVCCITSVSSKCSHMPANRNVPSGP